jgi:hypothetical protein
MIESIEIRRVTNGYVAVVHSDDQTQEYVFSSSRQAMRFVKEQLEVKND